MLSQISVVGETGLTLDPKVITLDLTGGDTTIINLTMKHNVPNSVVNGIVTHIIPDGKGIDVTYDTVLPLPLIPNKEYHVKMTITTAINIVPKTYTITSIFSYVVGEKEIPFPIPDPDPTETENQPPVAKINYSYNGTINESITNLSRSFSASLSNSVNVLVDFNSVSSLILLKSS